MECSESNLKCVNCGCGYDLVKGPPGICWVCGAPTDEVIINEI